MIVFPKMLWAQSETQRIKGCHSVSGSLRHWQMGRRPADLSANLKHLTVLVIMKRITLQRGKTYPAPGGGWEGRGLESLPASSSWCSGLWDLSVWKLEDSEMNYSLMIVPLHWQNGFNYIMVALNVIKKGSRVLKPDSQKITISCLKQLKWHIYRLSSPRFVEEEKSYICSNILQCWSVIRALVHGEGVLGYIWFDYSILKFTFPPKMLCEGQS